MFGESISFGEGLLVTALGMGVTFIALIALSFMLDLLRILFYKDPNKNKPVEVKKEVDTVKSTASVEDTAGSDEADEELIAVITAAIAASLNTTTHNIVVRNIVRVEDRAPAWNKAGRLEQMNQML